MKEYITIRNFGPLRDIRHMELKRYTFLIGESGIGKSTLMKTVSMMRYIYKMANIRSYLKQSRITVSKFKLHYATFLNNASFDTFVSDDSYIEYEVISDSGNTYKVVSKGKRLEAIPSISKKDLMFYKVSYVSENRNIIPMWTEKASSNAGATLGFYFNETNHDFSEATKYDFSVLLDYIGMELTVTHPKSKPLKLALTTTDGRHAPIDLKNASSGMQTSAPLVILANYFANAFSFKDAFKRSVLDYLHEAEILSKFQAVVEPKDLTKQVFIHVEEPELSLYPNAQCRLIERLVKTANTPIDDRTVNLMVATHSPYILNFLNVLLHRSCEMQSHIDYSQLTAYRIVNGTAHPLLALDQQGEPLVDTYDLTEDMNLIYDEYCKLRGV